MDFWPAMGEKRWSVSYLRKVAGYRTVPIEIGSKYTGKFYYNTTRSVL
jgi:lysine-specific demethylase 8